MCKHALLYLAGSALRRLNIKKYMQLQWMYIRLSYINIVKSHVCISLCYQSTRRNSGLCNQSKQCNILCLIYLEQCFVEVFRSTSVHICCICPCHFDYAICIIPQPWINGCVHANSLSKILPRIAIVHSSWYPLLVVAVSVSVCIDCLWVL